MLQLVHKFGCSEEAKMFRVCVPIQLLRRICNLILREIDKTNLDVPKYAGLKTLSPLETLASRIELTNTCVAAGYENFYLCKACHVKVKPLTEERYQCYSCDKEHVDFCATCGQKHTSAHPTHVYAKMGFPNGMVDFDMDSAFHKALRSAGGLWKSEADKERKNIAFLLQDVLPNSFLSEMKEREIKFKA